MIEYTIALPMLSNSGADYRLERERWERLAMALAGGYTRDAMPSQGVWQDKTGIVYHDAMQGYHVATDFAIWGKLTSAAFDMFPDQVAFYTVTGGSVFIHHREELPCQTPATITAKPLRRFMNALGKLALLPGRLRLPRALFARASRGPRKP